jgi:hypothetical protein
MVNTRKMEGRKEERKEGRENDFYSIIKISTTKEQQKSNI